MKLRIVVLLMLVAVFVLASCGKSENVQLEVEDIKNVSSYTIVRSVKASKPVRDAASELCTAFYKKLDASVKIAPDTDAEKTREIIIGETAREIKGFDADSLGFNEYIIKKIGEKIVIAGGSDKATIMAVKFVQDYLIVDGVLRAPIGSGYTAKASGVYENLLIEGNSLEDYTIVTNLYSQNSAKELAKVLESIGCSLPIVKIEEYDLSAGKYILFDDTNTDFSNHSVKIEGGNVTFFANYVTIFDCVDYFVSELLGYDAENEKIKGEADINIVSSMSRDFKVENTPIYTREKLLEVLGEVYEDEDSLIIAQHTYGSSNGKLVENERKRYKENCRVDVPMIGYDIVDTSTATRNERVKEAYDFIQFMREGGIVTFSCHLTNPIDPEAGYRGKPFTAQNWNDLFTEGTETNSFLMEQLSMVADFLEIFQKNGAPVIFRPLHEMNGNWFWFCITNPETGETISSETAQDFWKLIYNYMTETRGITNMLWEYSPNVASSAANVMHYYPGDDYCDLVACDWYTSEYTGHNMLSIASEALSETGKIFSVAEFGPNGSILTDLDASPEYKFNCDDLDELITEVRDDGIKLAYWMLWSSWDQVKISMWNMGEAEFFYENDIYLTLEDTFDLLYN